MFSLCLDILTEEDLVSLMNLLRPVAHKWETLCVQLGVSMGDIKNIGANPMKFSGAPLTFLQDGLYVWLQNSPGPKRSISALCDVLKGPVISEVTLGVEVEKHLKGAKGNSYVATCIESIIIIILHSLQVYLCSRTL